MASGFARFAKAHSAHSLGSFVDIASAASSEFEPVDLEDLDLDTTNTIMSGKGVQDVVIGKNSTPSGSIHSTASRIDEDIQAEENEQQGSVKQVADPLHEGLQNLEQATQKAAEAAKDFTSKLWVSGTSEAKSSVMRLAGDVSSWWANLDPSSTTTQEQPQDSARSAQGNEEVQGLFDLSSSEELMEKFSCTLIQTVNCTHNRFSEAQKVRSAGRLFITDKHSCFAADGVKFSIPHSDVKNPCKQQGGKKPSLQLLLKTQGEYVEWEDFKGSELDSALALLEHLTA